MNQLYYGDNLDVLQTLQSESADLVYLDPPFNSARNYNVIFARSDNPSNTGAQIQAFEDTWEWTSTTETQFISYLNGGLPPQTAEALRAFHTLLGENDALAYLVNMAPRLVELHRILKSSGSIWLHCDPTMSHYLKILLDSIFDPRCFRNEVIWKRTAVSKGHATTKLSSSHDVILAYGKSSKIKFFPAYEEKSPEYIARFTLDDLDGKGPYRLAPLDNPADRPNLKYEYKGHQHPPRGWRVSKEVMEKLDEEGRLSFPKKAGGRITRKHYLHEQLGPLLGDVWTDIGPLQASDAEKLGYPTQKPLMLLERIIKMTTEPGDTVLDPFCGCGTSVDAAQQTGRNWIGIDITYIAIDLILKRLQHSYGDEILSQIQIDGVPRDQESAQALFDRNPFDFERWAVSLVNAQPNKKQVGDKGIDGIAKFQLDGGIKNVGKILISVKGGKTVNPSMVRDLSGTVETQKAEMGILITQQPPTKGMVDAVNHGGTFTHPANGQQFPRLQIITTGELLAGKQPQMPLVFAPYVQAKPQAEANTSQALF